MRSQFAAVEGRRPIAQETMREDIRLTRRVMLQRVPFEVHAHLEQIENVSRFA